MHSSLQHITSNSNTVCMKAQTDNCLPQGKIFDASVKVIFIHGEFSEKTVSNIDKRAFCGAQGEALQHDLVPSFVISHK